MNRKALIFATLLIFPVLPAAAADANDVFESLKPTAGGLKVRTVVERVLETAPSVDRAEAGANRAQATANRAWVGYMPRLDLSGSYTRLSEVDIPPFIVNGQPVPNPFPVFLDFYSFDATVSVPLSDYVLQIVHGYAAKKSGAKLAALQLRAEREATALRATEAYIGLLRARAAHVVTTSSVDALTANHADVKALVNAGIVAEAERMQVAAQLASAKVAQQRAEGLVTVGETTIRQMLHAGAEESLAHGENFFDLPTVAPPNEEEVLKTALAERAEMKALEHVVAVHERWVRYYRGAKYPKLALNAAGTYANPNQRIFPPVDEFRETWSLGASIRWSPNDYIIASELTQDAQRDVLQSRADLQAIEDAIRIEVKEAVTFYATSRGSIKAASDALESARRSNSDFNELLSAGEATTRDVLATEAALRNAELQLVNAYLDVRVAQARLDRAMGRLTE